MSAIVRTQRLGSLIWLIAALLFHPAPQDENWAVLLLLFAALVIVPYGVGLLPGRHNQPVDQALWRWTELMQMPAAIALLLAMLLPAGVLAALLSLPWLMVTLLLALTGLKRIWQRGLSPLSSLCTDAGLLYLSVGGVWTVLSRYGAAPLQFDPTIVLLTAIHFHFAGFALPLLTGLIIGEKHDITACLAGTLVIIGVPLTAVGITVSQLGLTKLPESGAALLTALGGLLTGWLYLNASWRKETEWKVRVLWSVAGLSLVTGMAFAALYGLRFAVWQQWLNIPLMRALHGTVNAMGFSLCGLIGWGLSDKQTAGNALIHK